jgi:hypothetical protein
MDKNTATRYSTAQNNFNSAAVAAGQSSVAAGKAKWLLETGLHATK